MNKAQTIAKSLVQLQEEMKAQAVKTHANVKYEFLLPDGGMFGVYYKLPKKKG